MTASEAGTGSQIRRVVALGESMLRLSTRTRLDHAGELSVHVAGSESNVAVGLAQLGWDAVWLSALPETPPGRRVANELRACGVDVSHVRWVADARVGLFFVEFAAAPRATTVWYDRAGSAAALMRAGDLDPTLLDGADYGVVSGITAAIGDSPPALARRFATEAAARGAKVCVDVNYRPRLWGEAEAAPAIASLASLADILVCGADDAKRLWEIGGDPRDAVVRLRELQAPTADLVVLTVGEEGAVACLPSGAVLEQVACPTTVVDKIGAGDAFVAGLLWGLATRDVPEALRAGTVAAAMKCTLHGDHLLTTEQEFVEQLDDRQSRVVVR
jgi:2-dehydro-3-deoxygluconokinase